MMMCSNLCQLARCGDAIVQSGEECDDGNAHDTDQCLNTCVEASCGDGVIHTGVEGCDEGRANSNEVGAACRLNCQVPGCGDGVVEFEEECDDGNLVNDDGCTNQCTQPRCGDAIAQLGEECDDGNVLDSDACLTGCVNARCGDGVLQIGVERCDDGPLNGSADCEYGLMSCVRCSDECVPVNGESRFCGDLILDSMDGEECENVPNCEDCQVFEGGLCADDCSFEGSVLRWSNSLKLFSIIVRYRSAG